MYFLGMQHSPDSPPVTETVERPMADRPEFFRLPRKGGDPYFGCTRSWYLQTEREGQLKLVRLRQRGKLRGIVLVPYQAMMTLIGKQNMADNA